MFSNLINIDKLELINQRHCKSKELVFCSWYQTCRISVASLNTMKHPKLLKEGRCCKEDMWQEVVGDKENCAIFHDRV